VTIACHPEAIFSPHGMSDTTCACYLLFMWIV